MDAVHDGCSDKRRILSELSKSLKTVFVEASTSRDNCVQLKINCALINCIDRSLQHGLINLLNSYWPLVRSCSHTQTLETIETWLGHQSSHRLKGQAWLLATLVEGSLLSYLQCILSEPHAIVHYYASHAILRDPSCIAQFSSLLTGLESINFRVEKSLCLNNETGNSLGFEEPMLMKSALELPLNSSHGVSGTVMTSSMTSSLASPVDSGFTQLDSETDTASFSEVLLDADSASMKEEVAVLPVDPCIEKTLHTYGTSEAMAMKDEGTRIVAANPPDSDSASCDDSDKVVCQRKKNKSWNSAEKYQKRVSFHEETSDIPGNAKSQDASLVIRETEKLSKSFKTSASNLSRAVGDFSSFESEEEGVEIAGDLSLLGNEGIEELCAKSMVSEMRSLVLTSSGQSMSTTTPVAERGTPEGQEDPPKRWSMSTAISDQPLLGAYERLQLSNNSSPAPSCSSLRSKVSTHRKLANSSNTSILSSSYVSSVLSQTPSKACLVKKFLRSITEKKISNCRSASASAVLKKRALSVRKLNLYIHGASPIDKLSEEVLNELREEMENYVLKPSQSPHHSIDLTPSMSRTFCSILELSSMENILKILKARGTTQEADGRREALLTVVTDQALYIISNRMLKQSVWFHSDLSSVLVGPYSQWISFFYKGKMYQVNLLVSNRDIVSDLIGCIELCLRHKVQKQTDLPAVIQLTYEDFFRIHQWRTVTQDERVHHYSVVHALEELSSSFSSSSKPIMKSYFMYRESDIRNSAWKPGFFVLKDDVLHISSDEEERFPMLSVNLEGVRCQSVLLSSRPHTIEVDNLQIAAPDDFVAHEWLTALQKPCANVNEILSSDCNLNIINGSLILTESRIILMSSLGIPNADLDVLGKPFLTALISDVVSFQFGDEKSPWCFMEFSCREVHDSGGDFVLFFNSFHEMTAFRDNLWLLRPNLMQDCKVLYEKDSLHWWCSQVAANLFADWDFMYGQHCVKKTDVDLHSCSAHLFGSHS